MKVSTKLFAPHDTLNTQSSSLGSGKKSMFKNIESIIEDQLNLSRSTAHFHRYFIPPGLPAHPLTVSLPQ